MRPFTKTMPKLIKRKTLLKKMRKDMKRYRDEVASGKSGQRATDAANQLEFWIEHIKRIKTKRG